MKTNTMCTQMKPTKKRARSEIETCILSQPAPVPSSKRVALDTPLRIQSPFEYLMHMTKGTTRPSLHATDFHNYTDEEIDAYTMDVVTAVRSVNLEKLKSLLSKGQSFQSCNRFGESLIHMACRRGSLEMVKLFIEEAGVNIKCIDDFGRTPLHDACWTAEPNFELMDFLVSLCPALLFVSDKRGHTPLHYTRRQHWPLWNSFLEKRQETIENQVEA